MHGDLKVSVIGVGNLGSCIAYEIANRGIAKEIVLADVIKGLAEGNALDIGHAIAFKNNTNVYAGDYNDIEGSNIIVVTAGRARSPEMKTRLELLEVNKKIINDVAQNLRRISDDDAIIVTLTNPVDIMNYLMWKYTGFPRRRVIGSAGMLDSARFRYILSKKYGAPVLDVEAYVIGEHGDAQVPIFSKVRISNKTKIFTDAEKTEIIDELRRSALDVISKKGATIYAPANNTVNIIEGILKDEEKLYVCSAILDGEYNLRNLSIGVPVILSRDGIKEIIEWDLSGDEKKMFYSGAESIRKTIESIL